MLSVPLPLPVSAFMFTQFFESWVAVVCDVDFEVLEPDPEELLVLSRDNGVRSSVVQTYPSAFAVAAESSANFLSPFAELPLLPEPHRDMVRQYEGQEGVELNCKAILEPKQLWNDRAGRDRTGRDGTGRDGTGRGGPCGRH